MRYVTRCLSQFRLITSLLFGSGMLGVAGQMPDLPKKDGPVTIPAQPAAGSAERNIAIHLMYPSGRLAGVKSSTGLILSLHNWGGITFANAPVPNPTSFDTVVIGVDYYQSGDKPNDPLPYDFGYLQAMDALRALQYVYQGLIDKKLPFDHTRLYGMGGSGGGNVILMANKFAPRTFACIADCSGMASLTDDIAYNLPGGSGLNARYSKDPTSPAFLTKAMQEIRDIGQPQHLAQMAKLGNHCKIVVIHGEDDPYCLAPDKKRVVDGMRAAGLDVEPHFITTQDVDGKLIIDSKHSIGNRTMLMTRFAGDFIKPDSGKTCRLNGACDFDRKEKIEYPVGGGTYIVSYENGYPIISFSSR